MPAITECTCTPTEICSWCAEYLPRDPVMYPRERPEDQWQALMEYIQETNRRYYRGP